MIKIAVVDDRKLALTAIQNSVDWEKNGIKPIGFFTDGQRALEEIRRQHPDVVITDIVMPGMNGLEFCQAINDISENIKLIIISAYSKFEYAKSAIKLGVIEYFEKPLDYAALAECIVNAARQKQQEDEIARKAESSASVYLERFCIRLLSGSAKDGNLQTEACRLGFPAGSGEFACITVLVPDLLPETWRENIRAALTGPSKENCAYGPFSLRSGQESYICCAWDDSTREEELRRRLLRLVREARNEGACLWFGVGTRVRKPEALWESYQTSISALKYAKWFDRDAIFFHRPEAIGGSESLSACVRFEKKFGKLILEGDFHTFYDCVDEFEQFCMVSYPMPEHVVSVMEKTLLTLASYYPAAAVQTSPLTQEEGMRACFRKFGARCRVAFDVQAGCKAPRDTVVEQAKDYIGMHYHDAELSVPKIARQIGISPNYLGNLFKKAEHMSITEYIAAVRVNQAKLLLAHSMKPVSEVAESLGYSNQYYFSSHFKKITGYSPLIFRKKFS